MFQGKPFEGTLSGTEAAGPILARELVSKLYERTRVLLSFGSIIEVIEPKRGIRGIRS
jgi:hypothetical protein